MQYSTFLGNFHTMIVVDVVVLIVLGGGVVLMVAVVCTCSRSSATASAVSFSTCYIGTDIGLIVVG